MVDLSDGTMMCQRCGLVDQPRFAPGTGPHAVKAVCAGCGGFFKWMSKPKEMVMVASVNRVLLVGTIGKYGVEISYLTTGTAKATLTLMVVESRQGKEFTSYIPCEVYGKGAEAAGEYDVGQLVLCEGKLSHRKKGEEWEMVVASFELKPLTDVAAKETA